MSKTSANLIVSMVLAAGCLPVEAPPDKPPLVDPRPLEIKKDRGGTAPVLGRQLPAEEPPGAHPRVECPPNAAPRPAATARNEQYPGKLSREDVMIAMKKVEANVAACGNGEGGVVTVMWEVGADGGVLWAETTGSWARTPVGDCAARAMCGATMPASSDSLTVTYPFKI